MNPLRRHDNWVGGAWTAPASGRWFVDRRPVDDSPLAEFAESDAADVRRAVDCADQAFREHRDLGPSVREGWLLRAAEILQQRGEKIAQVLIEDTASPVTKSEREIATSTGVLKAAAGACRRVGGQTLPSDVAGRLSLGMREPLGVVAGITPFNVPLIKAVKHTAMALATGNSQVLMPSPLAPAVAAELAEIYHQAGVPAGLMNVVFGDGRRIGDALTGHPDVRAIGFTGSTATGRHIARIAAEHGKRVTLEMGGKNAAVVLADANLDQAFAAITMGAFLFQGQICMSTSRVFVQAEIFDDACRRLAIAAESLSGGDLHDRATVLGPMISDAAVRRVTAHIEDALAGGAELLAGGNTDGRVVRPTVLTGVTSQMRLANEETFGPVLAVHKISGLDDAVEQVNASKFGLVASIFTTSAAASLRFVRRCEAGMVHVNGPTIQEEAHVPFGGNGDSGFGREGAIVGIDELTRWKWATLG